MAGKSQNQIYSLDIGTIDVTKHLVESPCAGPLGSDAETTEHFDNNPPKAFEDLLIYGERTWEKIDDVETAEATPAALFITSGTTGLPKAAVLSHYAFQKWHASVYQSVPYQVSRARFSC